MRYLLGLLVTIGLLIILIVLILSSNNNPKTNVPAPKALSSYSTTDVQARTIVDGPINSEQEHQQIRITVGKDLVTYEQFTGYNGNLVNSQSYANTQSSYYNFLRALSVAGFTLGNHDPKLTNNTGYCPLGSRYNFQLVDNTKLLQNLWATGCGGDKTFKGNVGLTLQLFEDQVPNFETLTENLNISVN